MTLTKSWKTTIIIYGLSFGAIFSSIFLGIDINDSQITFLLGAMGITSAAGTGNAIFQNKSQIKDIIKQVIDENKTV